MADIKAFCGLRYDAKKVKKISTALAPPYDVISKKEQEKLHRLSPFNVVRLILGKEKKNDNAQRNKYTRARDFLTQWIAQGVLKSETRPSLYVYVQDYRQNGQSQRRVGFLALMRIDEQGVLKHENTLARPKQDRMALLKEVRTNLSPIFGLFEDSKAQVQRTLLKSTAKAPAIDVTLEQVRHRLFVESDDFAIEQVVRAMRSKPMFIADGHHRFEVACQFKRLMESKERAARRLSGEALPAWHYVMTYFSDCRHNPFTIFPTHRLLKVAKQNDEILRLLQGVGEVRRVRTLDEVLRPLAKSRREVHAKGYSFGLCTRAGFYLLTLKSRKPIKNPADRLDVAVLHQAVIEPCFGIRKIEKSDHIDFTRDAAKACQKVKAGIFDLAFFLRPTSLDEMIDVSKKGLKMPQKSTYFYPKLLSGLVFHKFQKDSL